MQTYKSASL
jgi:polyadenylate-binding protein